MSIENVRLDTALLAQAEELARCTGRTLTQVVEDALRATLARMDDPVRPLELPTYGGGWVRPGIDLDNSGELSERMDSRPDPVE